MNKNIPFLIIAASFLIFVQTTAGQNISGNSWSNPQHTAEAVFEAGPEMNTNRHNHNAVVLPNGNVALIAGRTTNFVSLNTTKIFDPATETFTTLTMQYIHDSPTFAKMNDGRYLIAGGSRDLGIPSYDHTEIFDPSNLSFTSTGSLVRFRASGGAAALNDGRVVIASAWWTHNDAHTYGELYDPESGSFSEIGPFGISRARGAVIPASDGRALLFGGVRPRGERENMPVEIFNPENNEISVLHDYIIDKKEEWVIQSSRTVTAHQQLDNGSYLWMANNRTETLTHFNLVTVNPETKEFEVMETTPSLPDSDSFVFLDHPVIDHENNFAYLIARVTDADPYAIAAFTVDLAEGTLTQSSNFYSPDGYELRSAPAVLLPDGRIFVSGGSVSNNFDAVNKTLFIIPPQPEATSTTPTKNLPEQVRLHQNYPNPFNPATEITFELNQNADVLLEVFDLTGQLISTLVNSTHHAGEHTITFDASGLSSGLYLYRLQAGNTVLTRKMIMTK